MPINWDMFAKVKSKNYTFKESFSFLQTQIHNWAVEKGFWDDEVSSNPGMKIALMHAELSECLEGIRNGNKPSDHIPEYSFAEEELADLFIRGMDFAEHNDYDIVGAIIVKMKFNETRPYKHGKKF